MKPRTISRRALLGTGAAALMRALPARAQSPAKPVVLDDASRLDATPGHVFDAALHPASGLWAALAAWWSARTTVTYLRCFGALYCLDGLLGLATGSGHLDLGIVLHGALDLPFTTRVLMNLPHIAIGGFAAFTGFVLARRAQPAGARR